MSKLGRSILLVSMAFAVGASKSPGQTAAIQVHVYDYAGLDQAELRHFFSLFEEIWVRAGLTVQVSLCRGALSLRCEGRPDNIEPLIVRLLPGFAKTMNHARRPPLGQSFVNAYGGGYSSVFLDSARSEAAAADASWVMTLAYASSHEVGHLLLGQAHTPRGLMKAAWDRGDYQAMAQNQCRFTQEQVRQMAQRSGAILTTQGQKGR